MFYMSILCTSAVLHTTKCTQDNNWPEVQDIEKYASSSVKYKILAGITNFVNSLKFPH